MAIQLATYSYYHNKTKKRESIGFFIEGKEVSCEDYLAYKDKLDMEYTQKTGEDNNGILRLKNINKSQSNNTLSNQSSQSQQSCPTNCPDCGEPYESSESGYRVEDYSDNEHSPNCECPDCLATEIINKCLYFVLSTDIPDEQKANLIFQSCIAMREVGFEEGEMEQEELDDQDMVSGDIYNISVTVDNNKNTSKFVGNIVDEIKKTKGKNSNKPNPTKQNSNLNVSEDK